MKKILVVDNNPLVLRLLASQFERLGHEVRTAARFREALIHLDGGPVTFPDEEPLILQGRQLSVILYPVADNGDSSVIALFRDITERRRAEETIASHLAGRGTA